MQDKEAWQEAEWRQREQWHRDLAAEPHCGQWPGFLRRRPSTSTASRAATNPGGAPIRETDADLSIFSVSLRARAKDRTDWREAVKVCQEEITSRSLRSNVIYIYFITLSLTRAGKLP